MDLLTVVMHELGHLLGHDHDDGFMAETLAAGERHSPTESLSDYDAALLALIDPDVAGTPSRLRKR